MSTCESFDCTCPATATTVGGTTTYVDDQGREHNPSGPSTERPHGYRRWARHGQLHRLDGPAIEYAGTGYRSWVVFGRHTRPEDVITSWLTRNAPHATRAEAAALHSWADMWPYRADLASLFAGQPVEVDTRPVPRPWSRDDHPAA